MMCSRVDFENAVCIGPSSANQFSMLLLDLRVHSRVCSYFSLYSELTSVALYLTTNAVQTLSSMCNCFMYVTLTFEVFLWSDLLLARKDLLTVFHSLCYGYSRSFSYVLVPQLGTSFQSLCAWEVILLTFQVPGMLLDFPVAVQGIDAV